MLACSINDRKEQFILTISNIILDIGIVLMSIMIEKIKILNTTENTDNTRSWYRRSRLLIFFVLILPTTSIFEQYLSILSLLLLKQNLK